MDDGMIELLTAFSLTSLGGVIVTTTGFLGGLTRIAQSRSVDITFTQSAVTHKSVSLSTAGAQPSLPPRFARPPAGSQLTPRESNFARVRRRLPRPYRIGLRALLFRGLRRRLLGEGTSTTRLVWARAESRDEDDDKDARTDGNVKGYATLHRGDVYNSSDDADGGDQSAALGGAAAPATPARLTSAPVSVIVQGTPDGPQMPPPPFFSPSNHVALARTGSRNRSARLPPSAQSDDETDSEEDCDVDISDGAGGVRRSVYADDGDAPLYLQVDGEAYRLYRPSWLSINHSGKINLVYFT